MEDADGRIVHEPAVRRHEAITAEAAFLTTSLMQDVVDRGTGSAVRAAGLPYDVPAAGKTGTTNDATDTWFVGVTPDVAAGVWIGFDQPRRILSGAEGGKLAAPVWGRIFADYYRTHPVPAPWSPPVSLLSVAVDVTSGMRATSACPPDEVHREWFIPGTEPAEYCSLHPEPGLGGWFRERMRDLGDLFER